MTITTQLPRSAPEAQGIPSAAILAFVEEAEQSLDALHSLMLLRHGHVVAEGWWSPYARQHPHMLFSLSKSFTSTAVGLAVSEGRLSVDDPVLSFFTEDAPASVSANLAAMRVRHLLSMSTGHAEDTLPYLFGQPDGNWAQAFLVRPVEHEPGTHFVYNSGATYMLSAIVQKVTGMKLLDYLQPRLLQPLGIAGATWESCPRGVNTGGWGLSIKTEDIAHFGQMYLQKGMWQGQRIVSAAWIEEATARQVSNGSKPESDWEQGYGYQFWRCRYGAYRGDGAFGQFCVVMPAQDAVLAITSGIEDMQSVLDLVWKHIPSACGPAPLPANRATQAALADTLASLALLPVRGAPSSAMAARVSGQGYVFAANEAQIEKVAFDFDADGCTLTVWDARGQHQMACGNGVWRLGTTTLGSSAPLPGDATARPAAASGAWTAEDTYTIRIYAYETPFCYTITARFAEGEVVFDSRANVAFGPTERPQVVGRVGRGR
jgi:CubicO group peptidase (beta-lactamase class C family)